MNMLNHNLKMNIPDHIREKLAAYLDGELHGRSYLEVQAHLETCPACQEELDELCRVSQLLHSEPLPEFTSTRRFTSQLMLQLPRRNEAPQLNRNFQLAGLLFPIVLLLAWVFIQVTFSLSSLFSIAQQMSLLGDSMAWLSTAPQQMGWFAAVRFAFGDFLSLNNLGSFQSLNDTNLFLKSLFGPWVLQLTLAGLYLAWLMVWLQSKYVVKKGSLL